MTRELKRKLLPLNVAERRQLMMLAWSHWDLLVLGDFRPEYVGTLLGQCNVASALLARLSAKERTQIDVAQNVLSLLLAQSRGPTEDERRLVGKALTTIDMLFGRVARRDLENAIHYVNRRIQLRQVELVKSEDS